MSKEMQEALVFGSATKSIDDEFLEVIKALQQLGVENAELLEAIKTVQALTEQNTRTQLAVAFIRAGSARPDSVVRLVNETIIKLNE